MLKFISLFVILSFSLFSQRIDIRSVNTTDYPNLVVEVDAYDSGNNQIRNLSSLPISINENGISRTIRTSDIQCEQDAVRFSMIILIDGSNSMNLNLAGDADVSRNNSESTRYELILEAVEELVRNIDLSKNEVALVQALGSNNVVKEFTQNRDSLILELQGFPEVDLASQINPAFNGVRLVSPVFYGNGAFQISRKAKYKPVIVYFSDGGQKPGPTNSTHAPGGDYYVPYIEDTLRTLTNKPIIYNMNFGDLDPGPLYGLATGTGGVNYRTEVRQQDGVLNVLIDILEKVEESGQALPPCEVPFITDCDGGGELEITINIGGQDVSATTTYILPESVKPSLQMSNRTPSFLNVANGASEDITVQLTAEDNDIVITDINSTDPRFTVRDINGNLTIPKGESRNVRVRFTADAEKTCIEPTITFVSDACDGNVFTPKAGWLNAMNVNVGSAQIGSSVTNNRVAFENNTCDEVTITGLSIVDNTLFSHNGAFPLVIAAGGTADLDFTYTPTATGNVSSDYTVTLSDGSTYDGTINGGGSGQAQIVCTDANQPTVKCSDTGSISFDIENTGEIDMIVSSIVLDNNTDFTLTSSSSLTIPSNGTETVNITFNPTSEGTKNASATITSNAGNEPVKVVNISGIRSNVSAQANTLDIGVICPNADYFYDLPITNNGEVAIDVELSTTSSEVTFPNGATVSLANVGSATNARVRINAGTIGLFDADIIIEDECGDQQTIAQVIGEVREASVDYVDIASISISSNVNETTTETLEIVNNDSRAISNLQITIQNNPGNFTIVGAPNSIAGNSTITVDVEYAPTTPGSSDLELLITGEIDGYACLSSLLDPVTASTNLAEATWNTSDYAGLIGQIITLNDVSLVDDNGFASSGVTEINFEIVVDSRLLESADGLPDAITGFSRTINYTYNVANPQPIRLRVLDPNDVTVNGCDIQILSASTVPVGRAIINRNDGRFDLIRANGNVGISDNNGKTGDAVTIVITGQDLVNVDANFHQKINGELKVNASILAPRGSTPAGRFATELGTTYRFVPFELNLTPTNPKVPGIQSEAESAELDFFVTLGDAETTEMEIVNLSSEVGVIDLEDLNIGTFRVTNVCKNDAGQILLLWRSAPTAPISIQGQNPLNDVTQFTVNALETGNYRIIVSDSKGNIANIIYEGELVRGEHQFILDPNTLSQGSYFINVITPSERFDKNFIYIK